MSASTITPQDLAQRHRTGVKLDLLDVRTPIEFREVHCDFARNVPLADLNPQQELSTRRGDPAEPLYVICHKGGRGQQACDKFLAAGFPNVVNVQGGTLAWVAAGLPVQRGKKGMSLERQVRIAAGSLVLLRVALSLSVHPYAIGLSAFVGAGLVFSGVTDTCTMGLLLARMPWNWVGSSERTADVGGPACQK